MSNLFCCLCGSRNFDSQAAGQQSKHPWLVTHQCTSSGCDTSLFTCNGTCDGRNIDGKRGRSYGESFSTMRQVRRHQRDCHKNSYPGLPSFGEDSNTANLQALLNDCSRQNGEILFNKVSASSTGDSSVTDFGHIDDVAEDAHEHNPSFVEADPGLDIESNYRPSTLPNNDGDESASEEDRDLLYEDAWPNFDKPANMAQTFEENIVHGNVLSAASIIVSRAAYQSPLIAMSILPLPNIMLFLYLSKLVMSSGRLQHYNLSKVLLILYPYAHNLQKNWAPIPCTVSGFRSRILNVSNSNSLVSILPIPVPETLPDGHGYTPFRDILRHALTMRKFLAHETKDPKWQSLASSTKFKAFLRNIVNQGTRQPSSIRRLAIGLLLWTDGWDTSTGCKSNRSPMHTGTITLLIVDVDSGLVVGIATYPNMGGPGKIDHGLVFRRLQEDITAFESVGSDRTFSSRHYESDVEVYTKVLFVVQDQPERRQASGLLGGGSRLHPLYGVSCDFLCLKLPFPACTVCDNHLKDYLSAKDWTVAPMRQPCRRCLGWSLSRLGTSSYRSSFEYPPFVDDNTPGSFLFHGPGPLPSSLLLEGWNHCIDMFALQNVWLEADVKRYLSQLCLNDATITSFIGRCRKFVYLREMNVYLRDMNLNVNPNDEYTQEEIAFTLVDAQTHPEDYTLPLPPAMWSLGDTEDKTEGIMHLSMGIQKAIFKFIIRWATENKLGSKLQRRLAINLGAVQDLKLAYCPCRPYKDEKFGGFTAEGYRAMTMTSPYIYRCLLETALEVPPLRGPNRMPQKNWTKQDNMNWMNLRGIEHSSSILASEAREQVRREMAKSNPPPIINAPPDPITTDEIRDLVFRMYNMFRAIFCTDIEETEAQNRATASVMRFLSLIERLDMKMNPQRDKPIWIAKFNFLGLLRICESFVAFKHVRNLYEGGVIGEGIVKELRPLVAKGVHGRWATNLLLSHYRNYTLDLLISALDDENTKPKGCQLGEHVESSKFKRYTTAAEIQHEMDLGRPIPVLIFGSRSYWKAGTIVVTGSHWYFRQMKFLDNGDAMQDPFGLTYHTVQLAAEEICFGKIDGAFKKTLGDRDLPFWDYAVLFPEVVVNIGIFRYAIVKTGWQYLDVKQEWSEFD